MAPAMPSTSARAGGIFVPIIKSLAHSVGSEPGAGGRAGRRGCMRACIVACGRAGRRVAGARSLHPKQRDFGAAARGLGRMWNDEA